MKLTVFSTKFQSGEVDRDAGIIRGVSVITRGEAKGHGMFVDDKMLHQVADAINGKPNGLKTRMEHGVGAARLMGKMRNARVEGDRVKACWHLNNSSPYREQVLELAEEAPEDAGMSIEFKPDREEIGGKVYARCQELRAVVLCENPAANDGLFEEKNFAEVVPEELAEVQPEDREEAGLPDGSYPVATGAQARSAIKLRGRSKTHSKSEILNHVARRVGELEKATKIDKATADAIRQEVESARKVDRGEAASAEASETQLQDGSVDNAVKANGEGSSISISTQPNHMDDKLFAEFKAANEATIAKLTETITSLTAKVAEFQKPQDPASAAKALAEQMAKLGFTPSAPAAAASTTKETKQVKTFQELVAEQVAGGATQADAINFIVHSKVPAHQQAYKDWREKDLGFSSRNNPKPTLF